MVGTTTSTTPRIHWGVMAAVALVVCAIGAVAAAYFSTAEAFKVTLALAVAYIVPLAVHSRLPWRSRASTWMLVVLGAILAGSALYFMLMHTAMYPGATLEMPYLTSDSKTYYKWALHHFDGRVDEPVITFYGFSMVMVALWHVLGVSLVWPVALGTMLTLGTVLLATHVSVTVLRGVAPTDERTIAAVTTAVMCSLGYFLSQGVVLLKEPYVYFAMTLAAWALARVVVKTRSDGPAWADVVRYAVACFILAAIRAKYVNFLFIGIAVLALATWRQHWRYLATLLVITGVCWWLGMQMTAHYTIEQQLGNVTGSEKMASIFTPRDVYGSFMGDYFHWPIWRRLVALPVTCAVHWLIPFPWLNVDDEFTWLSIFARLRYGWYIMGGIALYYYIMVWRHQSPAMRAWAVFPVLCFMGVAYMTAGNVSRYSLTFQPWLAVPLTYVIILAYSEMAHRKRLVRWMAVYITLLVAALVTCYILVNNYTG